MAQLLGNVAVGSIVKLKENGVPKNYIVVHQGLPSSIYASSCNGTWILREDILRNNQLGANNSANTLFSTLAGVWQTYFMPLLDTDIKSLVKTVKIPYCEGNGNPQIISGNNGFSTQFFLLSYQEVGIPGAMGGTNDGAKLAYFELGTGDSANKKRIANYNGSPSVWWLRSPYSASSSESWFINETGSSYYYGCSYQYGIRPAMVMPFGLIVDDSGNITSTQLPWPIPNVTNLTAPSITMQGQSIPISWMPVSISGFDVTYQLQRNINNEGWQNVGSPISQTSYTDTAQSGWTEVQYRVAPVIDDIIGNYTQSSIIPVSDPSVLVISGSDGHLGTLTSNVPYTVSSNTGNQISLTRTVNGAQDVTLTIDSGFAYSIPVADLPTGTGTIQITASVEDTSQLIQTQTRTWTYYKTPIDIPSTGGIAQLTQNGQNIWPVTVPDAVEAPVYLGGNLNAALNKLGQAALYTKINSPKYNQVTVDLSKVSVGDEVLLPYNDVMVAHIVVQIGNPDPSMYDSSCDGVWLLRKDCVAPGTWNSTNVNTLAGSTIMSTMAGYVTNYGSEVQSAIKTVKIPYCVGGGSVTVNNLANGLTCQMFPLSAVEVGGNSEYTNYWPIDGATLNYFVGTSGDINSSDKKRVSPTGSDWWLRSLYTSSSYQVVFRVNYLGALTYGPPIQTYGYRPCFIMPTTFNQTYYVDAGNGIHPSQEYPQVGSITDVFGYDVPIAQTEIGTYVGTGTAGQSSPNTLTFSFEPKVVFISTKINSTNNTGIFIYDTNAIYFPTSYPTGGSYLATTWQGNQISWYYANPTAQLNVSGRTYNYIAIG